MEGAPLSIKDVGISIINGCRKRGWKPAPQHGNVIFASILVNSKHYVEVKIPFTQNKYSIRYKSSNNMKYHEKKSRIHPKYNEWIKVLSDSIQEEFLNTQYGPVSGSYQNQSLQYDQGTNTRIHEENRRSHEQAGRQAHEQAVRQHEQFNQTVRQQQQQQQQMQQQRQQNQMINQQMHHSTPTF